MNMHSETITARIDPWWERFPYIYILGKIPHGPPTHYRNVECWGPPGFWHRIIYQFLYPGHPTAWGSPLSTVTHSTLLNLGFCFIHLQKESLIPDTSPWNQDQQHEDNFPGSWLTWSVSLHMHTPFPISSLLVTNHILFGIVWFLRV